LLEGDHNWLHADKPRARSSPASRSLAAAGRAANPPPAVSEPPQRLFPPSREQQPPLVLELSTLTMMPPVAQAVHRSWPVSESSPWTGLHSDSCSSHSLEAWPVVHFLMEADATEVNTTRADSALPDFVEAAAAVEGMQLGSPSLPTVGSKDHYFQKCKPCAFVHKRGCTSGVTCQFCHICGPEIKRRRQLERLDAKRRIWRQKAKEAAREARRLAELQEAGNA